MSDFSRWAGEKRPVQPPEESLHWISFNLKKLTEQVKEVVVELKLLREEAALSRQPKSNHTDLGGF